MNNITYGDLCKKTFVEVAKKLGSLAIDKTQECVQKIIEFGVDCITLSKDHEYNPKISVLD